MYSLVASSPFPIVVHSSLLGSSQEWAAGGELKQGPAHYNLIKNLKQEARNKKKGDMSHLLTQQS